MAVEGEMDWQEIGQDDMQILDDDYGSEPEFCEIEDWASEGDYQVDESGDDLTTGFAPNSYQDLTDAVMERLRAVGITGSKLAAQEGFESEVLTQALKEMEVAASYEARSFVLAHLYRAVEQAQVFARLQKRAGGGSSSAWEQRVHDVVANFVEGRSAQFSAAHTSLSPILPVPPRGILGRQRAQGTVTQQVDEKATKEAAVLERCQALLIFYIIEADTPSSREAASSADQRRAIANLVGKTRGSTASGYLRRWGIMRTWLIQVGAAAWPSTVGPLLDYIQMVSDEPCRPTVPQAWLQAIQWMYKLGGFSGEGDLSQHQLVLKAVERITVERSGSALPVLQAARYPTLILASLELVVTDVSYPPFRRIHAGAMLFKSWGTLRYDDIQRIHRKKLRMVGSVAQTELMTTKTSGPGKRIKQLPVVVSVHAQLLESEWLVTFLDLVATHLPKDRPYLLDRCSGDYMTTLDKELRYTQASALSRNILRGLKIPTKQNGSWVESDVSAVPEELVDMFTEHSPRSVVPSLALFVEEDKSKRDMVGRWRPSGSDDYSRTFRYVVAMIQARITSALKAGEGAGRTNEADVIDRAGRYLRERKDESEERIETVCTGWDKTLREFCIYLGKHSNSTFDPESVSLSSLVPLDPCIEPLVKEMQGLKKAVKRTSKYIVSYSRGSRVARLHKASNGCYWASTELRDCQVFDEVDSSMYNARCKFCWPQLAKDSDSQSDSQSSDTE